MRKRMRRKKPMRRSKRLRSKKPMRRRKRRKGGCGRGTQHFIFQGL